MTHEDWQVPTDDDLFCTVNQNDTISGIVWIQLALSIPKI